MARLTPLLALLFVACSPSQPQPGSQPDFQPPGADLRTPAIDLGPVTGQAVQVPGEADLVPGAPRLRLTLVDVGQGEGMVVWLPGGAVMAVDGGPDQDGAFAAFLRRAGITRIDYAVLSHPHADHYTGLPAALALLPADCMPRVFDPGYDRSSVGGYRYFRGVAGCRYRAVRIGQVLPLDDAAEVRVLSAYTAPFPEPDSGGVNNTSVVLRIQYHNFSVLLSGDAQTEAERALYERVGGALRTTVLKLGHHGSCDATGTSLLAAVAPQLALMSLGSYNEFGHPHCQTIGKLRASSTRWLRTDRNGNITLVSDGLHYAVSWTRGELSDPSCPRFCGNASDF
ncbi:MAG: MBL fold metallo-hydrolase [Myxococcales bacterium]|nr:MBL fold metallo-hydrolase [Myxococcota bacterium]MDW8280107.1 MBL fold metallo-hydrolase [Myxococcales bacterium]